MRRGVTARLKQRCNIHAMFGGKIWDVDVFLFFTELTEAEWPDEEIKEHVMTEAPRILLPSMLKLFVRSRWTGGEDVFRSNALLSGVHGVFRPCVLKWLGALVKDDVVEPPASDVLAVQMESDDEAAHEHQLVPNDAQPTNAPDEIQAVDLSKFDKDFWVRKRSDCVTSAREGSRGDSMLVSIVNCPMDSGLTAKLYCAGAAYRRKNDAATAAGFPRSYPLVEAAHNTIEKRAACRAHQLLNDASKWEAMLDVDKTYTRRGLSFRMVYSAQGHVMLNLYNVHKQMPYRAFYDLSAAHLKRMLLLSECGWDDWWAYQCEHFTQEDDSVDECVACCTVTAEVSATVTTNSECAHSRWQLSAKTRSMQTHAERFAHANAGVVQHQAKTIAEPFKLAPEPKQIGRRQKPRRPSKQRKPKARKQKTKKTNGVTKEEGDSTTKGTSRWGPYRYYLSKYPIENVFGPGQFYRSSRIVPRVPKDARVSEPQN